MVPQFYLFESGSVLPVLPTILMSEDDIKNEGELRRRPDNYEDGKYYEDI